MGAVRCFFRVVLFTVGHGVLIGAGLAASPGDRPQNCTRSLRPTLRPVTAFRRPPYTAAAFCAPAPSPVAPTLSSSAAGFMPRPSRHYDNAPVYMCIRHRPAPARTSTGSGSGSGSGAHAAHAEQERLPDRGQNWFSIPPENARELYAFLRRSGVTDRARDELLSCGSATAAGNDASDGPGAATNSGLAEETEEDAFFVVHEDHYAASPPGSGSAGAADGGPGQQGRLPPASPELPADDSRSEQLRLIRQESLDWELISRAEIHGGTSPGASLQQETLDEELPIPTLMGKTLMLTESRLRDLMRNLPTRAEGCMTMRLSYSTAEHGFSLATLYRRCKRDIEDRPCLLVIQSQGAPDDSCFGAILSHSMRISDHYYGNGETKLVRWNPELEVLSWTGENNYILKGGCRTFMVGSSSGRVALWLDEGLYRGRSQVCDTFHMLQPLSHDAKEDFIIENLEVWTFN